MQYVPLSPKIPYEAQTIERSEESAIAGEIACHLLEFAEATSKSKCLSLIQKLNAISLAYPPALWVVLKLLTGDMSEITRSYSNIGEQSGRTKQGVQQEEERVLIALHRHYPELGHVIIQLRGITAKINTTQ